MKTIQRKIESSISESNSNYQRSQASFNSDGFLTLRNYDCNDKSKDEIIIFNSQETLAIKELFGQVNPCNQKIKEILIKAKDYPVNGKSIKQYKWFAELCKEYGVEI